MFNLTPAVKNFLSLFGIVFLLQLFTKGAIDRYGMIYLFNSEYFHPIQFVTHIFMHGDIPHLLWNSLAFVLFGTLVERYIGTKKSIILFLFSGVLGGFFYTVLTYYLEIDFYNAIDIAVTNPTIKNIQTAINSIDRNTMANPDVYSSLKKVEDIMYNDLNPDSSKVIIDILSRLKESLLNTGMLGASGMISGIAMACLLYFPNTEVRLLFFPIPIKIKYLVLLIIARDYYSIFKPSGGNVAHLAHLTGAFAAIILYFIWKRNRNSFY